MTLSNETGQVDMDGEAKADPAVECGDNNSAGKDETGQVDTDGEAKADPPVECGDDNSAGKDGNSLQLQGTASICCWICLGEEDNDPALGPFIHPCKCTGTQSVCHRSCLETWLKKRLGVRENPVSPWAFARRHFVGFGWRGIALNAMMPQDAQRSTASLDSLSCTICGQRYSVRASSLRELRPDQWVQLGKSTLRCVLSILALMFVGYARIQKHLVRARIADHIHDKLDKIQGNSESTKDKGMMRTLHSALLVVMGVVGVLMVVSRVINQVNVLREDLQIVQAQNLSVDSMSRTERDTGSVGNGKTKEE
jgi:hypothetical protein